VKVMLLPTVTFLPCISPLSSVVNVPLEIHRDSGGFAMLRHSRRRRSPVLVVLVALHSLAAAAAAVMPVWLGLPAATSWFCLGIEPAFFYPLVMYLSRNAICDQCRKFFVDEFQVMIVANEP